MAEVVSLPTILAFAFPGAVTSFATSEGPDDEVWASMTWHPESTIPQPTLVEVVAKRQEVAEFMALTQLQNRRLERLLSDGGQDNLVRAIRILIAEIDSLRATLKDTSFTGGAKPNPVQGYNQMRTRINAIYNDQA